MTKLPASGRVGQGVGQRVGRTARGLGAALALGCLAAGAHAATTSGSAHAAAAMLSEQRVLPYPYEHVWPAAIRYLRVDRTYAVRDQDEAAGYILFDFPLEGGGTGSGSLEAMRTDDSLGRASVQVKISTGAGPAYLPHTLLEGLSAKVRAERGPPAQPPEPKPDKPAKPDNGDKSDRPRP